jgi:hypothetical protein
MKATLPVAALMAAFAVSAFAAAEVEFTPGASAKAYRKVMIATPQVEFDRAFLVDVKSMRSPGRRLSPDQLQEIAREMGEGFASALAESFKKHGFEIAIAPGSDVLKISPALKDLYVNAPENKSVGMVRSYAREAGQGRMVVEGSDATGARVVVASEQGTAGRTVDFQPASDVSNRFWFNAMFRRWADDLALALASAR